MCNACVRYNEMHDHEIADCPATLEAEAHDEFLRSCELLQDEIEATGGPRFYVRSNEIPF